MSATSQDVPKDIFEIYQRLFDHGSAIRGEINFFFQNFKDGDDVGESKRTRLASLLRCSQLASEADDIDWQKTISRSDIDKVTVKLDAAATLMEKLIERGRSRRGAGPYGDYVDEMKQRQFEEMQRFSADIQRTKERVDEEFRERVDDLERHFESLASRRTS